MSKCIGYSVGIVFSDPGNCFEPIHYAGTGVTFNRRAWGFRHEAYPNRSGNRMVHSLWAVGSLSRDAIR